MNWVPERYRVMENPLRTERRVELIVLGLVIVLIFWLATGLVRLMVSSGPQPVLPAEDSLEVQGLLLQESLSPQDATRILERPLFWEGRRPLAPPPAVAAQPTQPVQAKLDGVTLQGVYGAGETLGLIATVDGAMTRIVKGQPVKGWQLDSYDQGVATFVSGGRKATLPLELTTPNVRVVRSSEPVKEQGLPQASPPPTEADPETKAEAQPGDLRAQLQRLQQDGGLTFGGNKTGQGKKSK